MPSSRVTRATPHRTRPDNSHYAAGPPGAHTERVTAPRPEIRIGYTERNAAQQALDEHLTAGRLDPDEYADRFAAAEVARTQAQLDALFTDLPAPHPSGRAALPPPAPGRAPAGRRDWYRYVPESMVGRLVALVVLVLVAVLLFPFVVAAAVLYFVVFPRIVCGGRWVGPRPMWGWSGRPRQWPL
jgi:Domain of unknown function (DUF1707)